MRPIPEQFSSTGLSSRLSTSTTNISSYSITITLSLVIWSYLALCKAVLGVDISLPTEFLRFFYSCWKDLICICDRIDQLPYSLDVTLNLLLLTNYYATKAFDLKSYPLNNDSLLPSNGNVNLSYWNLLMLCEDLVQYNTIHLQHQQDEHQRVEIGSC